MSTLGTEVKPSVWTPQLSVIGSISTTNIGNTVIAVGRQNSDGQSWTKTEHVVLTPAERDELIDQLIATQAENPSATSNAPSS